MARHTRCILAMFGHDFIFGVSVVGGGVAVVVVAAVITSAVAAVLL